MRALFSIALLLVLPTAAAAAAERSAEDQAIVATLSVPRGRVLDKERVRAAIAAVAAACTTGTARVIDVRVPETLVAPECDYTLEALQPPGGVRPGTINVPLVITGVDKSTRRVSIPVKFEVVGTLLVATRDIDRGGAIGPEDLQFETRALPAGGKYVTDAATVEGGVTRVAVKRGQPVPVSAVGKGSAVEPGQAVRALLKHGSVTLQLDTVSRGRGDVGAIVPVVALGHRSLVRARVVAPGKVVIVGSEPIEDEGDVQ